MNPLEQVMLAFQALRYTVPQLWRPRLWLWAAPLAAAECTLVALLSQAAHPAVSWFMAPILTRAAGPGILHYPRIFESMPALHQRADLAVAAVLGSIAIGAAVPAFAACFRGQPVQPLPALAAAFRRAPDFIMVQLPFNLLLLALSLGAQSWLSGHAGGGLAGRALPLALTAASLVAQAACFYAAALVALEGRSAWSALRELPSTWRAGFLSALLVSVVTLLVLTPLHAPAAAATLLVERGKPELVGLLVLLRVATDLLNGFLLTGCATLLYLSVVRPAAERA